MERREKVSVVFVPFPYQGHTTPMLHLASILQSRGFSVIVAHADINSPHPSNHPGFVFKHLSSNLPSSQSDVSNVRNLASIILDLNNNLKAPLEEYLVQLLFDKESEHGRLVCLVRDSVMYFAESVAAHLKLPSLVLRTSMAAAVQPYHYLLRLQAQNRLPFPESKMQEQVPELAPLLFKDFSILPTSEIGEEMRHLISNLNGIKTCVGIIWNSMDHLEHTPLTQLQQYYNKVRFFPIGPLHKTAAPASTSFLEEDLSCISWLDKHAPNSVLYISFGSLASIEAEEMTETAWGLANSTGQPFLWVVRPGSVDGVQYWEEHLPDGFREMVGERGQIVKWAPQKQVLAHSAVGGFWSHCGWNSTLESMCEGVPMICSPRFADQRVNARYLIDKWKVGLDIENVKDRVAIERSMRRLMMDSEGKEMRERMLMMKAKAETAMEKGGSSYESLTHLTEFISTLSVIKGQQVHS